jgi:hypothetical protein
MRLRPAWIQTSLRIHEVRIHAVRYQFLYLLVANALRWFCRDAAHLFLTSFAISVSNQFNNE